MPVRSCELLSPCALASSPPLRGDPSPTAVEKGIHVTGGLRPFGTNVVEGRSPPRYSAAQSKFYAFSAQSEKAGAKRLDEALQAPACGSTPWHCCGDPIPRDWGNGRTFEQPPVAAHHALPTVPQHTC